jgi:hypothetical protein
MHRRLLPAIREVLSLLLDFVRSGIPFCWSSCPWPPRIFSPEDSYLRKYVRMHPIILQEINQLLVLSPTQGPHFRLIPSPLLIKTRNLLPFRGFTTQHHEALYFSFPLHRLHYPYRIGPRFRQVLQPWHLCHRRRQASLCRVPPRGAENEVAGDGVGPQPLLWQFKWPAGTSR